MHLSKFSILSKILFALSILILLGWNNYAQSQSEFSQKIGNSALTKSWLQVMSAVKTGNYNSLAKNVQEYNYLKRELGFINSDNESNDLLREALKANSAGNKNAAIVLANQAFYISPSSFTFAVKMIPATFEVFGVVPGVLQIYKTLKLIVLHPLRAAESYLKVVIPLLEAITFLALFLYLLVFAFNFEQLSARIVEISGVSNKYLLLVFFLFAFVAPLFAGALVALVVYAIFANLVFRNLKFFSILPIIIVLLWWVYVPEIVKERLPLGNAKVFYLMSASENNYEPSMGFAMLRMLDSRTVDKEPYANFIKAQLLRREGRLQEARRAIDLAKAAGAKTEDVLGEEAAISYAAGDFSAAKNKLQDLVSKRSSAEVLINLAIVAKRLNDLSSYSSYLSQALKDFSNKANYLQSSLGTNADQVTQLLNIPVDYGTLKLLAQQERIESKSAIRLEQSSVTKISSTYFFLTSIILLVISSLLSFFFAKAEVSTTLNNYRPSLVMRLLFAFIPCKKLFLDNYVFLTFLFCLIPLIGGVPIWLLVHSGLSYNDCWVLLAVPVLLWIFAMFTAGFIRLFIRSSV